MAYSKVGFKAMAIRLLVSDHSEQEVYFTEFYLSGIYCEFHLCAFKLA
jgi:hypothetical protein